MPDNSAIKQLLDEQAQAALKKVLGENPDIKPVTISPSGGGILQRLFAPKSSLATTNPFTGNITYDPSQMVGLTQGEVENTVAHELNHSKHFQNMPWYSKIGSVINQTLFDDKPPAQGLSKNSPINSNYFWRPEEMEAFQAERDRTAKNRLTDVYTDPMLGTRDIPLFPPRKTGIDTSPSK
jgi:hypothetical protein